MVNQMGCAMIRFRPFRFAAAIAVAAAAAAVSQSASANPFAAFAPADARFAPPAPRGMATAPDDRYRPDGLQRQIVRYSTSHAPGTIVIDTPNTYLYLVLEGGMAMRYGIGVGREGFTWSGVQSISRKAEWPDWHPPAEMLQRQPYLPRFMAGGPGNPLGARAMYLGGTIYRIHGTNNPDTIGKRVSSGCIRLTNEDVADLYTRVTVGTKVVVLPMTDRGTDVSAARRTSAIRR